MFWVDQRGELSRKNGGIYELRDMGWVERTQKGVGLRWALRGRKFDPEGKYKDSDNTEFSRYYEQCDILKRV